MRQTRTVLLALLIGVLPAIGLLPRTTQAAERTVGDGTSGSCSFSALQITISSADSGDTIRFNCPAGETTITFTNFITIDKTLTIDGSNVAGDAPMTFDGNHQTNMFNVPEGGHLIVQQLTFQHGVEPANDVGRFEGGAIDGDGGDITVHGSTFIDNAASYGGAIDNSPFFAATLTITQSSFIGNTSDWYGGAIYSTGPLTISQSSFTNNSPAYEDTAGGAIWNRGPSVISQSSFIDNSADYGGALWQQRSTLDISASTFSGNTAGITGSAISVHSDAAQATIRWSTIVQPANTVPSLQLKIPTTLEGVILTGDGDNCDFTASGDTSDSYTLADDTSCRLDGADSHTTLFPIVPETPSTITTSYGVEQTTYPLPETSGAVEAGANACTELSADARDQVSGQRPIGNCDLGAVESDFTVGYPQIASITPDPAGPYTEGQTVSFTVDGWDPEGDELSYQVDCGDGQFVAGLSCTFPDDDADDTLTLTVRATDGEQVVTAPSIDVTVTNVAPEITSFTATPSTVAATGQPIQLEVAATDMPAELAIFRFYCGEYHIIDNIGVYSNGQFSSTMSCNFDQPGQYTLRVVVYDDDGGRDTVEQAISVRVATPATLCANRWTGDLRMPAAGRCRSTETLLSLPADAPLTLCANRWTGEARYSPHGRCQSTEATYIAEGLDTIDVCINRWTSDLRIDSHCDGTERRDQL